MKNKILLLWAMLAMACQNDEDARNGLAGRIGQVMAQAPSFQGYIMVGNPDTVRYERGFGYADRENRIPFGRHTVFDIGSVTKPFTAIGIIRCAEEGLLAYSDTLGKFFPEAPADKAGITVHQLLTHSAGMPESVGDDYTPIGEAEFLRRVFAATLAFAPGSQYAYSNVGYSLLGIITERATQGGYEAWLNAQCFAPAKMATAGYLLPRYAPGQVAMGYDGQGLLGVPGANLGPPNEQPWADSGPYWPLRANGGLLMSAVDFRRYCQAIMGAGLLGDAAKKAMYTRHRREGDDESFIGYGWSLVDTPQGPVATHNGGNGVFFVDFAYHIDTGRFVLVATNAAHPDDEDLLAKIWEAI